MLHIGSCNTSSSLQQLISWAISGSCSEAFRLQAVIGNFHKSKSFLLPEVAKTLQPHLSCLLVVFCVRYTSTKCSLLSGWIWVNRTQQENSCWKSAKRWYVSLGAVKASSVKSETGLSLCSFKMSPTGAHVCALNYESEKRISICCMTYYGK